MAQLHDELGQVGLPGGDALFLQVLVEVGLLGGDGLDLDDLVHPLGLRDLGDDLVGFLGVAGPVHVHPVGLEGFLGLQQVGVEVTPHPVLDLLGGTTQALPVRGLGDAHGALVADRRGGIAHVLALHTNAQLTLGGFGELRHPQERSGVVRGRGETGHPVVALGDPTQFGGHGQSSSVFARISAR